jgi:ribonuclease HI
MSILSISVNAVTIGSKISDRPRWARPEVRHTKVHIDDSYHVDLHAGSLGAVIRDHNGKFIAASTLYLLHVASAAATEAMAMREGLALATRLGCNDVIMESDSMETMKACMGVEAWWGKSSVIFADCVDLATLIDKVSFKHCPHEANEVAHELARDSFSSMNSCNWDDEPPSFILSHLINDVSM